MQGNIPQKKIQGTFMAFYKIEEIRIVSNFNIMLQGHKTMKTISD